eukprot:715923_1
MASEALKKAQNRAKEILNQRLVAEIDASKMRKDAIRLSGDVERDTKAINEKTQRLASHLMKKRSVKSELEAAKKAVSNINQEQLNEIKALKEPPKLVDMTMRAVATLMCIDVQEMLASNDFIPSIRKFTYYTNEVTKKKINKEFYSNRDFTFERVNSECKVCGPLVRWVRSQVRMAGVLDLVGPLTQEIKELKDTVVVKQKEADALHATVKELEA